MDGMDGRKALTPEAGWQAGLHKRSRSDSQEQLSSKTKKTKLSRHVHSMSRRNSDPTQAALYALKAKEIRPSDESVYRPEERPVFDFQFASSDQEVLGTLDSLIKKNKDSDIILMNRPDGLDRDNLVHRLTILQDGKHYLQAGRLFQNESPVKLVLDIRNMTAWELGKFNDLLDPDHPSLYDTLTETKKPLGRHVSILVLANPRQLKDISTDREAPGADFWRRVNRPKNTWQTDSLDTARDSMEVDRSELLPEYVDGAVDSSVAPPVTINVHMHADWRQLLFGGPGMYNSGKIRHIPGKLERLAPGQAVILKGADWSDPEFQQHIRWLQERKQYESNGKTRTLPENIQFFRADVHDDELGKLCESAIELVSQCPDKPVIINSSNLNQWLNPIKINEAGYAIPNTSLLDQIKAGATVTVTSPLSEPQWFMLLGQLQAIYQQTLLHQDSARPGIFLALPDEQPKQLAVPPGCFQKEQQGLFGHPGVQAVTYSDEGQVSDWLESQANPLVVRVNAQTRPGQLFDNIHVQSEQMPRFGRCQTQLQQALSTGKPVVFLGLETNPEIQQFFESLCCQPPSIIINGVLQEYPQADIRLLWPESRKSSALLWSAAIQSAEQCAEVDLWDSAAARHGIAPGLIPKEALEGIYSAFDSIPKDIIQQTGLLPVLTGCLLDNLIIAARQAQDGDASETLGPVHWRKAINSVLTHCTRQNPAVRDFMKVACERLLPDPDRQPWVDPERLAQSLRSLKKIDRSFVRRNFWQLARAFDPGIFKNLNLIFESPDSVYQKPKPTDVMCALLAAYAPEDIRKSVEIRLQPDPKLIRQYQGLPARSSVRKKRLEDALASGWSIKPDFQSCHDKSRSRGIETLANTCYGMATDTGPGNTDRERIIKQELEAAFIWQGTGEAPFGILVDDLLHGKTNQPDRELRRISRLKARLAESPVVFIQGETGTGKSYFAAQMARESGPAFIFSASPFTNEKELIQRWNWKKGEVATDRTMERLDQTLLQWAKTLPATEEEYVTLVMDEANLSQNGLLDCLKGLWRRPPCIYVDGQPVAISSRHRVIFTGNPDSYAGRHMDSVLQEKIQRVHYPVLNRAFLQDRVVEPALFRHLSRHLPEPQAHVSAQQTTRAVMALWQHYQTLLPDHEFTPRDLTDICAWVGWYLNESLSQSGAPGQEITQQQVNALVLHSFRDVLGQEMTSQAKESAFVMEDWFSHHFPADDTLISSVQNNLLKMTYNDFRFNTGLSRPDFDTSSAAVTELVEPLVQDLLRCQQAYQHKKKHGGRQATLVEGPTGRGKDVTLQLLINSFSRQVKLNDQPMPKVDFLNACDCSWGTLRSHIQKARSEGNILVISEMNLIDSQHLEGELNDILAGDAHPGFHLFATTNPPHYTGRKPLSPALKGRFRFIPIREYNRNELTGIAKKTLPDTTEGKACAARITDLHCHLRRYLQKKNIPLHPTGLDLQELARAVSLQGADDDAILKLFKQHYHLYLFVAQLKAEDLASDPLTREGQPSGNRVCDRALGRWLNQSIATPENPWLVRREGVSTINRKTHEITVPAGFDEQAARVEVVRQLAELQWRESGMPLEATEFDDTLTQSLYRLWQCHCFHQCFGQTGISAEQVFSLSDEQAAMSVMKSNKPYLAEASRRMARMDASDTVNWPDCWEQIKDILNEPASAYQPEPEPEKASETSVTTRDVLVSLPPAIKMPMDTRTGYKCREVPTISFSKVFNSRHDYRMYRFDVYDLHMTPEGGLTSIRAGRGEYGLEAVNPGILPSNEAIALGSDQYYGIHKFTGSPGRWLYLPGLTPHETIISLRTDPEQRIEVIKDRYTGLHMLHAPDAEPGKKIAVHYILDTKGHSGKSREIAEGLKSTRPDATCSPEIHREIEKLLNTESLQSLPEAQRKELQAIVQASSVQNRITAIRLYCRKFQGTSDPDGENLLAFLLNKRQGGCVHRTPVFVAFCRYYGIPARIVSSEVHSFPEYSLDNGQTWIAEDLGGAPAQVIENEDRPVFSATRKGLSVRTGGQKMSQILKKMSPEQIAALAKVLGVNPEGVDSAIQSGTALPTQGVGSIAEMVERLWQKGDQSSFILGSELLKSKDNLEDKEASLAGSWFRESSPMATCVLHSDLSSDAVQQELQQLHAKMVDTGAVPLSYWQYSIIQILQNACDHYGATSSAVVTFARKALEQGWLNPLLPDFLAMPLHRLLKKLEAVDEVKPLVTRALQDWYNHFPGKKSEYDDVSRVLKKCSPSDVPEIHGGSSPTLESSLKAVDLMAHWTDEPEGIPDIERLLTHYPAFPVFSTGKTQHRPVIMLGSPLWGKTELKSKAKELYGCYLKNHPTEKALFKKQNRLGELREEERKEISTLRENYCQRNEGHRVYEEECYPFSHKASLNSDSSGELQSKINDVQEKYTDLIVEEGCRLSLKDEYRLSEIEEAFSKTIQRAFSHYLYQITNSKGGRLTFCWVTSSCPLSGCYNPRSPEELMACMENIHSLQNSELDNTYLRQALKSHNRLVLGPENLTGAANEFINSLDSEALYKEVTRRVDVLRGDSVYSTPCSMGAVETLYDRANMD